jgi:RHS repeat-associated protein
MKNETGHWGIDRGLSKLGEVEGVCNTNVFPNTKILEVEKLTLYPNGYININQNGEYTKHYYAETQRIASKIGGGFSGNITRTLVATDPINVMKQELGELVIPNETINNIIYASDSLSALQGDDTAAYESGLYFYHGNHLSSTQVITNLFGNITQQVLYAPFGEVITEHNAYWHNGLLPDYMFNAKELDEESGMYYYEARYYAPPTFISRDPLFEKYPTISPYAYCSNNPVNRIDPSGMDDWKPDSDGNLIAEKGDNAWTLAKFLNIKPQEAISQLKEQGYKINNGILDLKIGDKVTLDNVYTRNLTNHGDLSAGDPQLNYNCWGSAIAGVEGIKIQNGVGIDTPKEFDSKLQSNFSSVDNSQAHFGETIIRFAEEKPYQGAMYNGYEKQGLVSRNPNNIGGASHGAVYYGTSQNGTIYVYTKNGWYAAPKIMPLQEVIKIYGNVSGLNNDHGYYNKK